MVEESAEMNDTIQKQKWESSKDCDTAQKVPIQHLDRAEVYDSVEHPTHYCGKIECIDVIEQQNMPYHLGNVQKYIWRWVNKHGIEDLRKARWYLDRYIALLGGEDE